MKTLSLFSGIGGLEAGDSNIWMFCESNEGARKILKRNYPGIEICPDIRELDSVPNHVETIKAGFPCQDVSSIGLREGLKGEKSSLVSEIFRILEQNSHIRNVILENVTGILWINKSSFFHYMIDNFRKLKMNFAWRTINCYNLTRQKRKRVIFMLSRDKDPSRILFQNRGESKERPLPEDWGDYLIGVFMPHVFHPTVVFNGTPTITSSLSKFHFFKRDFPYIYKVGFRNCARMQAIPDDYLLDEDKNKGTIIANAVPFTLGRFINIVSCYEEKDLDCKSTVFRNKVSRSGYGYWNSSDFYIINDDLENVDESEVIDHLPDLKDIVQLENFPSKKTLSNVLRKNISVQKNKFLVSHIQKFINEGPE